MNNASKIMPLTLQIDNKSLIKSIKLLPWKDKAIIAESIEENLLSEWDAYEESSEVKDKIKNAFEEYQKGNVINLKDLIKSK